MSASDLDTQIEGDSFSNDAFEFTDDSNHDSSAFQDGTDEARSGEDVIESRSSEGKGKGPDSGKGGGSSGKPGNNHGGKEVGNGSGWNRPQEDQEYLRKQREKEKEKDNDEDKQVAEQTPEEKQPPSADGDKDDHRGSQPDHGGGRPLGDPNRYENRHPGPGSAGKSFGEASSDTLAVEEGTGEGLKDAVEAMDLQSGVDDDEGTEQSLPSKGDSGGSAGGPGKPRSQDASVNAGEEVVPGGDV